MFKLKSSLIIGAALLFCSVGKSYSAYPYLFLPGLDGSYLPDPHYAGMPGYLFSPWAPFFPGRQAPGSVDFSNDYSNGDSLDWDDSGDADFGWFDEYAVYRLIADLNAM